MKTIAGSALMLCATVYLAASATAQTPVEVEPAGVAAATRLAAEQGDASAQNATPVEVEDGLGLDRAARRQVQEDLQAAGFDPGGADGVFGPRTRAAIQRWQTSQGVLATGYLDGASLVALSPSVAGQPTFRERVAAAVAAATRLAAEQGDASAQFDLGLAYDNGRGVEEDDAEAVRWYRLAAEQGLADAQFNLGNMYRIQRYVNNSGSIRISGSIRRAGEIEGDDAEAVRWYRLAAEQGHADAQFNLGDMYTDGLGVAQDYAEATLWYHSAAEQGHASGQDNLGSMYAAGRGVARDDAEAVRWYRLAAEQGHASGQNNLGVMYAAGRGVARDDAEAVRWYRLAAEQGHADARVNLYDNLGIMLRDLQLSEGLPERGFMASSIFGALPAGNVSLVPAFEPGVMAYSATVSRPLLTIRARAARWRAGAEIRVGATGTAAGGAELRIVNQSHSANDRTQSISVTLDGLQEGENTIRISASRETHTVVVTREPDATLSVSVEDPSFGDDSGRWPNDGDCDDPRFVGDRGSTAADSQTGKDATDCRTLFLQGRIRWAR